MSKFILKFKKIDLFDDKLTITGRAAQNLFVVSKYVLYHYKNMKKPLVTLN